MEIRHAIRKSGFLAGICLCAFMLISPLKTTAQLYIIKHGKIYIQIDKHIPETLLDSFINRFDLADLDLKQIIKTGRLDSLKKMGWEVELNNDIEMAISKILAGAENLNNPAEKFILTAKEPTFSALFPAVNNGTVFGYNRFRNKAAFIANDSLVTFYLRNYAKSDKVTLAGSFNNWDPDTLPMTRTDSGWIANIKLGPGKYWYKFIVNGKWITDDDNQLKENDGRGNTNSVYYKTNYVFRLDTFSNAGKIYLAGNFNNWRTKDVLMKRTPTGWELPVYLANGTYTYKYIVDGRWTYDVTNPERFPNEFNDFNSVIHLGKPYYFRLKGYENANKVLLTGSFNYWRKDELYMQKTASGWEFPYTLSPGNYEYRFIVDGKEIIDPDNDFTVNNYDHKNSYLVLEPNYTFRLKGYPNAKQVFLGADFNNFIHNFLAMNKEGDDWVVTVHLTNGKHIYKFIVDGNWIRDPANELWEQNRFGTGDSVLWFGE